MTTEARVADTPATSVEERLAELERVVEDLGRQVGEFADDAVYPAELSVLPGLELRRPIPIVVEESADDAVARWIEPGLYGMGGNENEAIESLREEIHTVWHDLSCAVDSELTRNTQMMRSVLRRYVQPAP